MESKHSTSPGGTVAFLTMGCKLNQSDSQALARQFVASGYELVEPHQPADVIIVNTCSVTQVADRKARHLIRQMRRKNPHALLVATGCYAQRAPQELQLMPEVDRVVGNRDKTRMLELLGIVKYEKRIDLVHPPSRTRAMVKIQEGCNQVCAFCIVPRVRGRERSRPIEEVVKEVQGLVCEGYREVVLTGTQIGSYYNDISEKPGRPPLEVLVERILEETGIQRLRISSLQPQDVTPGLMNLLAQGRLCRHLHVPLQSGSDSVLRSMRRRYTTQLYREVASRLRELAPELALTTDILVGFPGESAREFEEGYRFCEEMGFVAMHVFPYSLRPGTTGAFLPSHVDARTKRLRIEQMIGLARASSEGFRRRFLGRTLEVLWEERKTVQGLPAWSGLTDNYIRAFTVGQVPSANCVTSLKIGAITGEGVWGELVTQSSISVAIAQ